MPIETDIELFVSSMLDEYDPYIERNKTKVIHDAIFGSIVFRDYEVAILDSPLIQRLRRISQLDIVPLIFPSSNHNRYEHSLGVAFVAEKLANAVINNNKMTNKEENERLITHIRLAGILHDCGHCAFSHISEDIYKNCYDIQYFKKTNKDIFNDVHAHELLSYLIIKSKTFKKFFHDKIETKYKLKSKKIDLDLIAGMVIQKIDDPKKIFWAEIINGTFDADKLDYIQRDSHFSGIQLILDLDRLFHTICLAKDKNTNNIERITIGMNGVNALEQIIFDKMMLMDTVYNHHTVRAAECLFKSIFHEIKAHRTKIGGLSFKKATDFLALTDDAMYGFLSSKNTIVSRLVRDLTNRVLPKRALVISNKTIRNCDFIKFNRILALNEHTDEKDEIKQLIYQEANKNDRNIKETEIWLDIPKMVDFREAMLCPIKIGKNSTILMREVIPTKDWLDAYKHNKWKGNVFTVSCYRDLVNKASKKVFEEYFGIKFNKLADN